MRKKCFILILSIFFAFLGCAFAEENYSEIYEKLEPANFDYLFNIDPYQTEDYTRYKLSPYPLLRTAIDFKFKNIVIPSGYYLLTPRVYNKRDYVLFKQNGKVVFVIPVYKKEVVEPGFYKMYVPQVKKNLWNKMGEKLCNFVGRVSKDSKRTPPPKSYIEVNDIENQFWELVLYYGSTKYYLLFLKD